MGRKPQEPREPRYVCGCRYVFGGRVILGSSTQIVGVADLPDRNKFTNNKSLAGNRQSAETKPTSAPAGRKKLLYGEYLVR